MSSQTMNKLQLCAAGSIHPDVRVDGRPVAPRKLPKVDARKAAAAVLGAVLVAIAAAAWLVASRVAPLQVVDLPKVVIQAERLAAGSCPVPVEPAGANCPVPTQAPSETLF